MVGCRQNPGGARSPEDSSECCRELQRLEPVNLALRPGAGAAQLAAFGFGSLAGTRPSPARLRPALAELVSDPTHCPPPRPRLASQTLSQRDQTPGTSPAAETPHASRITHHASAHQLHNYLHLVVALGANAEPLPPHLTVTSHEVKAVAAKFRLHGEAIQGRPILGLNPGAEYGPAKRWPAQKPFLPLASANDPAGRSGAGSNGQWISIPCAGISTRPARCRLRRTATRKRQCWRFTFRIIRRRYHSTSSPETTNIPLCRRGNAPIQQPCCLFIRSSDAVLSPYLAKIFSSLTLSGQVVLCQAKNQPEPFGVFTGTVKALP